MGHWGTVFGLGIEQSIFMAFILLIYGGTKPDKETVTTRFTFYTSHYLAGDLLGYDMGRAEGRGLHSHGKEKVMDA